MKIFITGITGFIGQSLFEFYNNSNHHVKGYLRGENLINSLNEFNPDVIINCAGEIYNIELMQQSNIDIVYQILNWMKINSNCKLIQLGSSAEYGPVPRASSEIDRINPIDVYQATKGAASLLCQGYSRQFNLKVVVARIYSGFGIYERSHRLMPRLYRSFFKNESMKLFDGVHDFIYIDDFIRGVNMLINKETPLGEIVNFGSGVQYTNLEVLEIWKKITGITPPVEYEHRLAKAYETSIWKCDINYAKEKYGFLTEYSLEDGIKNFIKRMQQ